MNKENNKSAAGLRRSAVAERIRLREEWSALKGVDPTSTRNILVKKALNPRTGNTNSKKNQMSASGKKGPMKSSEPITSDALRGVVALVEVGCETRALPLRAALTAMGASVLTTWSPLVTHCVWTDSGCRATRAKARALACKLVSPLWVEACASANCKLNERTFPAASRQSDLPSPRTLRQLLKKAEQENVPLIDLLADSKDDSNDKDKPRLRISSDTDVSTDRDTTGDATDVASRVNTAPRRVVQNVPSAVQPQPKSRRKLFTHKEAETMECSDDETDAECTSKPVKDTKLSHSARKDLARAERVARKLLAAVTSDTRQRPACPPATRIVLTGMSRLERKAITEAVHKLNGFIQKCVNKRTTHVLLGSCRPPHCANHPSNVTGVHCDLSKSSCWSQALDKRARTASALRGAARGCRVLHARWALDCAESGKWLHHNGYEVMHLRRICEKARVERAALGRLHSEYAYDVFNGMRVCVRPNADQRDEAISLLTLCGAKIVESDVNQNGEVIQNGDLERTKQNGRLVRNGGNTQVTLTGRLFTGTTQNGGLTNNLQRNNNTDVVVGKNVGDVNSKWVFDSVAAARMRTTRRYVNMNSFTGCDGDNRW